MITKQQDFLMASNRAVEPDLSTQGSEFDHYADSYKELLSQSTGDKIQNIDFYAKQKVRILHRILAMRERPSQILDFGCGIGLSLSPLQETFPESQIYATDPSEKSLTIATKNSSAVGIPFADFNSEKFPHRFDLIFSSCVLHHIDESEHVEVLSHLFKFCLAGGILVIAEHNPWNPITQRMVNNCVFDEGVTLIPLPVMKRRMLMAGWKNPRGRFMSFVPARLRKIGSIDLYFGWCPLGGQYMTWGIKDNSSSS